MSNNKTAQALNKITDPGTFERMATAILRLSDARYSELGHTGVNASGKTKKAPVDGFSIDTTSSPPNLIAVHHTIAKVSSLERKWLFDPENADPEKLKNKKPTTPMGDVIKTGEIVARWRNEFPSLNAKLILTTNEEPDDDLIGKVKTIGNSLGMEIEFWARSRLANFLDIDPDGQYLRHEFLGINQKRLSRELLIKIGQASLDAYPSSDQQNVLIPRAIETEIKQIKPGLTLLLGKSGFGKSVSCHAALLSNLNNGKCSLVLPHMVIEQEATLDGALQSVLQKFHTPLLEEVSPLSVLNSSEKLLIWVEDINRSTNPEAVLEKLASWCSGSEEKPFNTAQIICPVWPETLSTVRGNYHDSLNQQIIRVGVLTEEEGIKAVQLRSKANGLVISTADAKSIAEDLEFDPLLIALRVEGVEKFDPSKTINQFIEFALSSVQRKHHEPSSDLRKALNELVEAMLLHKTLEVKWQLIYDWNLSKTTINFLKLIIDCGEIISLSGNSEDQKIRFRHDRIRDSILIDVLNQLDDSKTENDHLFFDPFLTRLMAEVIAKKDFPSAFLERMRQGNGVVLFRALKLTRPETPERNRLIEQIKLWCAEEKTSTQARNTMVWHAEQALENIDGTEVIEIVRLLPNYKKYGSLASIRNGDVVGVLPLMKRVDYGVSAPFRDRQIDHAKHHHLNKIVNDLNNILKTQSCNDYTLSCVLSLVGFIADARLSKGILESWRQSTKQKIPFDLLADYLWAASMCCTDENTSELLDPICSHWEFLPESKDGELPSQSRDDLAANSVRFGFMRTPPDAAIRYFISIARTGRLQWQIYYMLHTCYQWDALEYSVEFVANLKREKPNTILPSLFNGLGNKSGIPDSSRTKLYSIFSNTNEEEHKRTAALNFWAVNISLDDVSALKKLEKDDLLSSQILCKRLTIGDPEVISQFLEKLNSNLENWTSYLRYQSSSEITAFVAKKISERAKVLAKTEGEFSNIDYHLTDYLVRLPTFQSERILVENWDGLKKARRYVQAALYCATPTLNNLVAEAVNNSDQPEDLFKHITSYFGIKHSGHPGVTKKEQLLALESYLDFLGEFELNTFSDECNSKGWFELRGKMFDNREECKRSMWLEELAIQEFDEACKRQYSSIDYHIDMELEKGLKRSEYLSVLLNWYDNKQTIQALNVVCDALRHIGTRKDYDKLKIYDCQDHIIASHLLADTKFSIQARTFN